MASPTLPQLTMSTTDPLASCIRTVDCSATADATLAGRLTLFTNAIAAARFGDLIVIEPGDVLDGNWALPKQTLGTAGLYTVIRPKNFDTAVAIGKRATSNSGMTTLRSVASSAGAGHCDSVITVPSTGGTSYWWISGLEVVPKVGTFCDGALVVFSPSNNAEDPANQTDHMMLDRCYLHGDDPSGTNGGPGTLRGLIFAGTYQGCINSTLDDIKHTDAQGEGQSITMGYGAGPVHIENNLLGATAQSVLFETNTGERLDHDPGGSGKTVTYSTGTPNTVATNNIIFYDAVGKVFNFNGSASTATITAVSAPVAGVYTLSLSGALSGVANGTTGLAFIDYGTRASSFFPGDITIKRNHMRKRVSWNIREATFERNSGGDTGYTGWEILGTDNTKIKAGTATMTTNQEFYLTTNTGGWIAGPVRCTGADGSGNFTMTRALGTVGSTGGAARLKYNVKNALEFKSGSRILVEGNVFDTSWAGGQTYILTFTPRYTNSPAGDLTFQYNVVKDAYAILTVPASEGVAGGGTPPPWLQNDRITMKHNKFENIKTTNVSNTLYAVGANFHMIDWPTYASTGTVNGVAGGAKTHDDFVFEHNTVAGANSASISSFMHLGDDLDPTGTPLAKRFIFRNNIVFLGDSFGPFRGYSQNTGTTGLDQHISTSGGDARTVTKNVFFDTALTGSDFTGSTDLGNAWVTTANRSTINFTNYAGGDYSIASGTYDNWGSDGTDPGADIGALNAKTAGAITGVWPAQLYLPIRWP